VVCHGAHSFSLLVLISNDLLKKMITIFATSDFIAADFKASLWTAFFVLLAMAVTAYILAIENPTVLRLKSIGYLTLFIACGMSLSSYSATYGLFIKSEMIESKIGLTYAGFFGDKKIILKDKLETILVGTPRRNDRGCYVKIILISGDTYKSALLNERATVCREIRNEMLSNLKMN
jgi:hypothetical protein